MALFGEKYGDVVRVVSVGDWARELCGGTHVARSGQLGVVKLLGESSIGAGVRRVEALVGVDAYSFLAREHVLLNSITELIKGSRAEELPERISQLLSKFKEIEKELAQLRTKQALSDSAAVLQRAQKVGDTNVITHHMGENLGGEDLRVIALDLRAKLANSVVALSSVVADKVVMVVAVDDLARVAGFKAGALVKLASGILGGGGGGKDDFAQGGGVDTKKIDQAFQAIKDSLVKA